MKRKDKIKEFIGSLRFRLLIVFLIIGIVPVLFLQSAFLASYINYAVNNKTVEILAQTKLLGAQILGYNYLEEPTSDVVSAQLSQLSSIYDGRIMLVDSSLKIVEDTFNMDKDKTIISEQVVKCFRDGEATKYDKKNRYIELVVPLVKDKEEVAGAILVSVSTDSIISNRDHIRNSVILLQVAILLVIIAFAIGFSGVFTRPFKLIKARLDGIKAEEIHGDVEAKGYTELKKVLTSTNLMMHRLDMLEESRQEFVSNVSHELKTPLTSMKVLADSLIEQDDTPVELYREFMVDIADEIERENQIINDLLSLVKLDRAEGTLNIETIVINDLIDLVLKRLRPIAEKQNVELVLESFRSVTAEVDQVKLTLAVSNLVENAIKYNKDGGWVHVSLNADHEYFFIKIEDNGIGMPEDSLEKIFERFYRVDKSHSREIGGTGLGLAITRNAVLMHRGDIKVHSEEDVGTTFIVRIPLNYVN